MKEETALWWAEDCKGRQADYSIAKKAFGDIGTIQQVEAAKTDDQVFKLMR